MTRVVIYCPDRHIEYDGRTPERVGVGGGITARIRMAKALASLGHDVTMVVHCMERTVIDGVDYVPLDGVEHLEGDIAIVNTSGGDLDLSPVFDTPLKTKKTIVWVLGCGLCLRREQLYRRCRSEGLGRPFRENLRCV